MSRPTLAILGGTGAQGAGLALRWAAAGYPVVLGSRDSTRAAESAAALWTHLADIPGTAAPRGLDNRSAAAAGDIVVLAVPYEAVDRTLSDLGDALAGKIVVSVVVPLKPPKVSVVQLPPAGSAAAEIQTTLGPQCHVVAAFQNVAAAELSELGAAVSCDVLVCGDDGAAKAEVIQLAEAIGLTAYDAGPLANAGVVEGLSSILIGINRRHKVAHAGVRITHSPRPDR